MNVKCKSNCTTAPNLPISSFFFTLSKFQSLYSGPWGPTASVFMSSPFLPDLSYSITLVSSQILENIRPTCDWAICVCYSLHLVRSIPEIFMTGSLTSFISLLKCNSLSGIFPDHPPLNFNLLQHCYPAPLLYFPS